MANSNPNADFLAEIKKNPFYGDKNSNNNTDNTSDSQNTSTNSPPPVDINVLSADCVVAVFPFKHRNTFNYKTSISNSGIDVLELAPTIFLDSLVQTVKVTNSKSDPVSQLFVSCSDSPKRSLLNRIAPGDWIGCWMFDNKEDAAITKADIKQFHRANQDYSGLKFIGRVTSVRAIISKTADGATIHSILIQGGMFLELTTELYFDPSLAPPNSDDANFLFWTNFRDQWRKLWDTTLLMRTETIIAELLSIITQKGFGKNVDLGNGLKLSPNTAYHIPHEIASLLGVEAPTGDNIVSTGDNAYLDILHGIYGVQLDWRDDTTNHADFYEKFIGTRNMNPTKITSFDTDTSSTIDKNTQFTTGTPLIGEFRFPDPPLGAHPIWQVLQGYLNPCVNEMYTTLDLFSNPNNPNPNLSIVPQLVVRQSPLSTSQLDERSFRPVTPFNRLPRWILNDSVIYRADFGTSESLRTNYVQVYGQPWVGTLPENQIQRANTNPVYDAQDVLRNGVRSKIMTVNIEDATTSQNIPIPSVSDTSDISDTEFYTQLLADKSIGSHLKLTGGFEIIGIQAPIAIGHNVEYKDILGHIEMISHEISVFKETGIKRFTTFIQFSNGVNKNSTLPILLTDFNTNAPSKIVNNVGIMNEAVISQEPSTDSFKD